MARSAERPDDVAAVVIFEVVREPYGWSVRLNGSMMTPFQRRELAALHAESCAAALRSVGQDAAVVIRDTESSTSEVGKTPHSEAGD